MNSKKRDRITFSMTWLLATALALLGYGCSPDYSPKPMGYPYMDIEEASYIMYDKCPDFIFGVDENCNVRLILDSERGQRFDIEYPHLNVSIFCTYYTTNANEIDLLKKETLDFLRFLSPRTDDLVEQVYEDPEEEIYSRIYYIKGRVASPTQFYLTNNTGSFLRGALHFNTATNQDSLAPLIDHVNKDIKTFIESFRWKKLENK